MLFSIVTAVLPGTEDHLEDTYRSVCAQGDGVAWEWLLQIDGPGDIELGAIVDDERVAVERNTHRYRQATTRMLAVGRANGDLIKVVDGDDLLTEGQLECEQDVFVRYPEVAWTASRAEDLLPDGRTVEHDGHPRQGRIPQGALVEPWQANDYLPPAHPATVCVRAAHLFALGGWMALPRSEDTGLLLALNTVADGYFLDRPGLLYRKWDK